MPSQSDALSCGSDVHADVQLNLVVRSLSIRYRPLQHRTLTKRPQLLNELPLGVLGPIETMEAGYRPQELQVVHTEGSTAFVLGKLRPRRRVSAKIKDAARSAWVKCLPWCSPRGPFTTSWLLLGQCGIIVGAESKDFSVNSLQTKRKRQTSFGKFSVLNFQLAADPITEFEVTQGRLCRARVAITTDKAV